MGSVTIYECAHGAHQVNPADDSVVGMSYQASEAGLDEGLSSLPLPSILYMDNHYR